MMACPAGFACDPTALTCAGAEAVHIASGCSAGGGAPLVLFGFGAALLVVRRRRRDP
jgi:MYXO-CTERM domain-containing protein